jgi:hypothetical protein
MLISNQTVDSAVQRYLNTINFARSTPVSTAERTNWFDFARGLAAIVDWSDVVEVWSCRSGQNSGAGTTVYGLKLALNGTMQGSPSWQSNGIRRAPGANSYVALDGLDVAAFGKFSIGGVTRIDAFTAQSHWALCDFRAPSANASDGSTATIQVYCDANSNHVRLATYNMTGGDVIRHRDQLNGPGSIVGAGFVRLFGSIGPSSSFPRTMIRNGVEVGGDGGTGTAMVNGGSNTGGLLRSQVGSTGWDATLAFAFMISTNLSTVQLQSLDALYATTLGKELT